MPSQPIRSSGKCIRLAIVTRRSGSGNTLKRRCSLAALWSQWTEKREDYRRFPVLLVRTGQSRTRDRLDLSGSFLLGRNLQWRDEAPDVGSRLPVCRSRHLSCRNGQYTIAESHEKDRGCLDRTPRPENSPWDNFRICDFRGPKTYRV